MTDRPPNRTQTPAGINLSLGDVYHIIFRHQRKILMILGAGVIVSLLLPVIEKVPYASEAKLYIRYVLESSSPTADAHDPRIKSPDTRGESIINTELEILTSLDLAQQVADTIGPEKILGSGERDRFNAGAVVCKNLTAEVPKNSSVIRLTFKHPNREIVQPVLQQVIDLYLKKHTEIHAVGAFDDILAQETEQLRADLAKTERDLTRAKTNLGFYASLEDAKKYQGEQIARIRQAISDAEADLAERKAAVNELATLLHANPGVSTNKSAPSWQKVVEYKRVTGLLEGLYQREKQDSLVFTAESTRMRLLRAQIDESARLKAELEAQNPELAVYDGAEGGRVAAGPNPRGDLVAETARIAALDSKIAVLNSQLDKVQREAAAVGEAEGTITKLQLEKEIEEGRLKRFVQGMEQTRIDEKVGKGKVSNISAIQKPSPPVRDNSKLQKTRVVVVMLSLAIGLGIAFVLELFVDRSVKHAVEIEGKLGLPLFLTVPLIQEESRSSGWLEKLPRWSHRNGHNGHRKTGPAQKSDIGAETDAVDVGFATHDPQVPLQPFFEALRDRLISFCEIKNLAHKPKLVALTSCREGAGVSTLASGLAASLSETGDGNVLLVDMNQQNGKAQHFLHGRLNCGLDDALESEKRSGALVQENLYVVSEGRNGNGEAAHGKLSRILPKRFTNLLPKLKASDYDFIIFDMPCVNQLSITPRLARFMDIVLVVIEAEKTDRDVVKKAATLLAESKPSVGAILNKRRNYVPKNLQQEF
jgi:succinoglycan biosynthesis transport protein ExoP